MNKLVLRLLRRHISPLQFLGFFLANLVGVTIILVGCQFYQDAMSVLGAKDRFMKGDYIILSKQVRGGLLGSKGANSFSSREVEALQAQSFAKKVARFTPSKFQVSAGLQIGLGVSTYMFFEAVPEDFLDVKAEDWLRSCDGRGSDHHSPQLPRSLQFRLRPEPRSSSDL